MAGTDTRQGRTGRPKLIEARKRFAEGHNAYLEKLARDIVDEEMDEPVPEYWESLELLFEFLWPWRASGRTISRSGRWDEEELRFQASLRRLDANLEYWIAKVRKEKTKTGSRTKPGRKNDPDDLMTFFGGTLDGFDAN